MGDRISIQFKNKKELSVVFFSHWDGKHLIEKVEQYIKELNKDTKKGAIDYPRDRREPNTIMVDFIRWYLQDSGRTKSNHYLGATENDGDNSDNGHWVFDLINNKWDIRGDEE